MRVHEGDGGDSLGCAGPLLNRVTPLPFAAPCVVCLPHVVSTCVESLRTVRCVCWCWRLQGLAPPEQRYLSWAPESRCAAPNDEFGSWPWRLACMQGLIVAAQRVGRQALVSGSLAGIYNLNHISRW